MWVLGEAARGLRTLRGVGARHGPLRGSGEPVAKSKAKPEVATHPRHLELMLVPTMAPAPPLHKGIVFGSAFDLSQTSGALLGFLQQWSITYKHWLRPNVLVFKFLMLCLYLAHHAGTRIYKQTWVEIKKRAGW